MYCTTLFFQKRIVYRCFSLFLLISLLLYAFPSTRSGHSSFPQEWEVWDEVLVSWLRRQWSRRRYRCHTLAGRLAFLRRRGWVLLCRLLRQIFEFTADGPQWRDKVLLERLFALNEVLMARLQAGEGLTPQLILEVETLKEAVGAPITPLKKTLPFAFACNGPSLASGRR